MTRLLKFTMVATIVLASASAATARDENLHGTGWRDHNTISDPYNMRELGYGAVRAPLEHRFRGAIEPLNPVQKKFQDKAVGFD